MLRLCFVRVEVGVIWACWDTAAVGLLAAVAFGPIDDVSDEDDPVMDACDSGCDMGATTGGGGGGW